MAVMWPEVYNYILTSLPLVSGWQNVAVFDGRPNTGDDPSDYATVGWAEDDSAGSFQQDHLEDYLLHETGTVRIELTAQSGDDDPSIVRGRVFGYVDAVDGWLRRDQSFGGLLLAGSVRLAADAVRPVQNERGEALSVVLTVTYEADTPYPG